uniref:Uncharacterized protein n=1 Tax=Parasteatoda tepidariorum TaxID=114398 RepID=A0A2L2YSS0_PARTP
MMFIIVFFLLILSCNALLRTNFTTTDVAISRQAPPLNSAMIGFFAPPLIAFVSMSALFYTFEKFTKDMVKAATERGKLRLRRRKKKPTEAAAQNPPTSAAVKQLIREHRNFVKGLENGKPWKSKHFH